MKAVLVRKQKKRTEYRSGRKNEAMQKEVRGRKMMIGKIMERCSGRVPSGRIRGKEGK